MEEIFSQSLAVVLIGLEPPDVSKYMWGPVSPCTVQSLRHVMDFMDLTLVREEYPSYTKEICNCHSDRRVVEIWENHQNLPGNCEQSRARDTGCEGINTARNQTEFRRHLGFLWHRSAIKHLKAY